MNDLTQLKSAVVEAGRQIFERGLVAGTWGNISLRSDSGDQIAVTPSGSPYTGLQPTDIVVVSADGHLLAGQRPSSELPLHLAIYAARPMYSPWFTLTAFTPRLAPWRRETIPPCLEEMVQVVGGGVEVAEYALPGTAELARNAVKALADRTAVLLANHGAVACGPNLPEALLIAELVEKAAQIHAIATQFGGGRRLDEEDIRLMRRFYVESYRQLKRKG
jgi:L-fuculose-phosphate aldolase